MKSTNIEKDPQTDRRNQNTCTSEDPACSAIQDSKHSSISTFTKEVRRQTLDFFSRSTEAEEVWGEHIFNISLSQEYWDAESIFARSKHSSFSTAHHIRKQALEVFTRSNDAEELWKHFFNVPLLPELLTYQPSAQLSLPSIQANADHQDELPPSDGGRRAWLFMVGGFMIEGLIWGIFP